MKNRLSPSVLAADFSALAEDLRLAEDAGAESFHFDIMDGHFVPNLSYGVNVVSALRKQSSYGDESGLLFGVLQGSGGGQSEFPF